MEAELECEDDDAVGLDRRMLEHKKPKTSGAVAPTTGQERAFFTRRSMTTENMTIPLTPYKGGSKALPSPKGSVTAAIRLTSS